MSQTPTPKFYSSKDKEWTNDKARVVEFHRLTKAERREEKAAAKLIPLALVIQQKLAEFKELAIKQVNELYNTKVEEAGGEADKAKGNWQFFNFEKTVRIQRSMQNKIVYDEAIMAAAKQKLDEYIKTVVLRGVDLADKDNMLIDLINDAFAGNVGGIDHKKVATLLSYKNKYKGAKHALWHQGCDLIISAQRVDGVTPYLRFYTKDANGKWQNIDLNFSSL